MDVCQFIILYGYILVPGKRLQYLHMINHIK